MDPQGKEFAVEFQDQKPFSEIANLGDAVFLSKVPMQVCKELSSVSLCVCVCVSVIARRDEWVSVEREGGREMQVRANERERVSQMQLLKAGSLKFSVAREEREKEREREGKERGRNLQVCHSTVPSSSHCLECKGLSRCETSRGWSAGPRAYTLSRANTRKDASMNVCARTHVLHTPAYSHVTEAAHAGALNPNLDVCLSGRKSARPGGKDDLAEP